ncbi:MAG: lysophospholipid acyltransferase family protein [Syntrophobacteraceae bacterium]|nr:lysophospholipid acyltransferase family protein [Syntrophobacteraceae bacterium]
MVEETVSRRTPNGERQRAILADRMPFLPPLLGGALRLWHWSCRFTLLGTHHEEEALSHGPAVLYACWHFAYPAVVYHFRDRNGMLMVSRSRDGEWMARVLEYMGFQSARGSRDKGGGTALRRMIGHIRAGYPGGLIADGSQGPPLIAQKGILILARHTGAPLVPVSMAARPCWRFPTWDRTVLVKPFGHVFLAFGSPIWVDPESSSKDLDTMRRNLESSLKELTRRCEEALRG